MKKTESNREEYYRQVAADDLAVLRGLAKEKGLTEQEIADRSGFLQPNVHRMLAGRYIPRYDNFLRLKDAIET